MTKIRMTCGIDGCTASWYVATAMMKTTMQEHRRVVHPDWVQPGPKRTTPYRLEYGGRARQF